MADKTIMVVGGGITGLAAAYYIQKQVKENKLPYAVSLLEQSGRLGGKVLTERVAGFVIEKGPDSFLGRKTSIIDLAVELGLEQELVGTNPEARKNYILHRNRLHVMPPGLVLGIPTQLSPFVKTGLISPLGKLRAGMDLFIPARKEEEDESLGAFLQRRLGKEVAENIAEPLLSGIYAGDTQALSLDATFPQFKAVEKKYGSIIKGMLKSRKAAPAAPQPPLHLPQAAKQSMFLTFRNGLQTLIEHLQKALDQVEVQMNQPVWQIIRQDDHYLVRLGSGEERRVDAVILATPAFVTQELLSDLDTSALLAEIPYVSVANVALAYRRADIDHPLDASGFVVPRKEDRHITACTWTSSKWPTTTPKDNVLLRCYVGHSRDQSHVKLSDEELLQRVRSDIKELMGIAAEPMFYRITRWNQSMPQYRVGHLQRLERLRADLTAARPGIFLAGAGYRGVGVPDCIQQGKQAAEDLLAYLRR